MKRIMLIIIIMLNLRGILPAGIEPKQAVAKKMVYPCHILGCPNCLPAFKLISQKEYYREDWFNRMSWQYNILLDVIIKSDSRIFDNRILYFNRLPAIMRCYHIMGEDFEVIEKAYRECEDNLSRADRKQLGDSLVHIRNLRHLLKACGETIHDLGDAQYREKAEKKR